MTAIVQNPVIEHLPLSPITYRPSSNGFKLVYPDSELYAEGYWLDLAIAFIQPSSFQYVVASNTAVPTANVAANESEGDAAVRSAMDRLDSVICALTEHRPLPPLQGLEDLLDRAVKMRGTPANIEEWSRQLALDVRDLTD